MNINLKSKFIILGTVLVLLTAVNAVLTYSDVETLDQQAAHVAGIDNLRLVQMQADMMHDAIHADMSEILAIVQKEDANERQKAIAVFAEHKKTLEEAMSQITKSDVPAELKVKVTAVADQFATYLKGADAMIDAGMDKTAVSGAFDAHSAQFHLLEKSQYDYENNAKTWKEKIDREQDETVVSTKRNLSILAVICALVALAVPLYTIFGVFRPQGKMMATMQELAQGNNDVEIPYAARRDEMGDMAKTVLVFKENAQAKARMEQEQKQAAIAAEAEKKAMMRKLAGDFQSSVQDIINGVAAAATELYQTAEGMQKTVANVGQQSTNASSASQQTSSNVQSVSAAVEEMAASVKEIASQISKSSTLVTETVQKTQQADKTTQTLTDAVHQISGILELIQSIASQINLLALNATIESARAGDAGKGFAVVASEVKNLAGQTTKATEEIAKQIASVQQASNEVVEVLKTIQSSIGNVNQYSSGIASAVEQQSAATNEISVNMHNAASGVQNINNNIADITKGAADADHAAGEVLSAAQMLSKQSEMLNEQVKQFLAGIAA